MNDKQITKEREIFLKKAEKTKHFILISRILILVVFFAVWEISAQLGLINSFILSSPSRMLETAIKLLESGEIWEHLYVSCKEVVIGFTMGTIIGSVIAILLWYSETLAEILDPYLVVLNALPKTALGPVFIVWLGSGEKSIIAMTLAISLIVTILSVYNGLKSTDTEKIRLLKTLGASKYQMLTKLVLPANLDTIINALKVNVGLSWVGAIMGEFLVSKAGLGYLIVYGSQVFKMDLVMMTVIVLAIASAVMYKCVLLLEKALIKYMGVSV